MEEIIRNISVYALPVLFAITVRESAHAYAAKYFGDNTAFSQGRMSLNPLVHIDLLGTIVIPILTYIFTPFVFGYAKPVPVDFSRLRNPKRDMAFVSLAGPLANFIMATVWAVFLMLLVFFQVGEEFPRRVAEAGIFVNLLIMAFNLLPIPPLDGGRVLISILPHRLAYQFARIEPYGFFVLLALLFLGALRYWVLPVMQGARWLLELVVSPLAFLLF